jgi:hypothetical protein
LGVADVGGLAHFQLYRSMALAGNPSGLAVAPADLLVGTVPCTGTTSSYSTVEPAIDLTVPPFLMFAWRMAGDRLTSNLKNTRQPVP